ncbi:MAG: hypothetical protein H0U15_09095 [Geodermatophilaceae bacterium]|nr:hypothetical protein [Geodermatophilaceae bacterium]
MRPTHSSRSTPYTTLSYRCPRTTRASRNIPLFPDQVAKSNRTISVAENR